MKKKTLAAVVFCMTLCLGSITVSAATCNLCEQYGVVTNCQSYGQRLWTQNTSHTVKYSEGGVLKQEACTITKYEDSIDWVCLAGHGVVSHAIRHVEAHSSTHCESKDHMD